MIVNGVAPHLAARIVISDSTKAMVALYPVQSIVIWEKSAGSPLWYAQAELGAMDTVRVYN